MTNFHNTIKQKMANYTQVPNEVIYDPNLSGQAKAVFCYLASKPEDWEFYVAEIQKHFSKSITPALKELQNARWIHKQSEPIKGKGKGFNWVWYIASKPFTDSDLEELQKKHQPSLNPTTDSSNYTPENTMIVESAVYNNTESITNTETKNSFINKTIKKLSLFADYEYLFDALEQWLQYKQSRRQSYKNDKSILTLCKRLNELSGGNADIAMQVVEQSMANNWSGLFPLKNQPLASNEDVTAFVKIWNTFVARTTEDIANIRFNYAFTPKVKAVTESDVRNLIPSAKSVLSSLMGSLPQKSGSPAINGWFGYDQSDQWRFATSLLYVRWRNSKFLREMPVTAGMFLKHIDKIADPYNDCYLDK